MTDQNLRELSTMSSSMVKRVRKSRSTSSASDIESPAKRLRFNFITYENVSSEDKSSLKCFDKMLKFSAVSDIEITSH